MLREGEIGMKENGNGEITRDEQILENETDEILSEEETKEEDTAERKITLQESLEIIKNFNFKLEKMEAENKQLLANLQRLQADFDNYRRRTRKEKEVLSETAVSKFIEKMLPVLDDFERAFKAGSDTTDKSFYEGIQLIFKSLYQILENEGLQAIAALGSEFDPEKHEALMQVEANEEFPDNIVAGELQKGYLFKDNVLRPSKVQVAKNI